MNKSGIYIHIPFCRKRCTYCDFYFTTNLNLIEKFLDGLIKEIGLLKSFYKQETFDSIFFGGGTPSVLSNQQIENILNALYKNFHIESNSEISIESNPEDFIDDDKKLIDFRALGINRLSLGIQSFVDKELKFLTRSHTSGNAESVLKASKKYFDNISVDIIYSLPSQTQDEISVTLEKVTGLEIPHVSAYTLIFEEGTILFRDMKIKNININSDVVESELYFYLTDFLVSRGYNHYEISNYAKSGYESEHNKKYWNYINYLGLGPGSHSFYNNTRWNNFKSIEKYCNSLKNNILPAENERVLNVDEMNTEYIMLALRSPGINFKKYEELTKRNFIERYSGAVRILTNNGFAFADDNSFRLTEKGFAMLDEICKKYF